MSIVNVDLVLAAALFLSAFVLAQPTTFAVVTVLLSIAIGTVGALSYRMPSIAASRWPRCS